MLFAGLSAARQLRGFGFKVVVLEGRDRPGGRVYTKQLKASFSIPPLSTHVIIATPLPCFGNLDVAHTGYVPLTAHTEMGNEPEQPMCTSK